MRGKNTTKLVVSPGERVFVYEAVAADGTLTTGKIAAADVATAMVNLRADGMTPIEVTVPFAGALGNFGDLLLGASRGPKLKPADAAIFARRLHQLVRAGTSLPRAFTSIAADAKPGHREMFLEIADKITEGSSFTDAVSGFPRAFDEVMLAYVTTGETTGDMVETTRRLAELLGKRAAMRVKVRSATAYAKMVTVAIALLLSVIFIVVIPRYEKIFASFNSKLPLPTRVLVAVSHKSLPGIAVLLVLFFGVRYGLRRKVTADPAFAERWDRARFRMPILGKLWRTTALFNWAATLAGTQGAGVNLVDGLRLAGRATGSHWHRNVSDELIVAVNEGRPLHEAMAAHPTLYPPAVRTIVATGEEVGSLADMLDSAARTSDEELEAIIAGLASQLEVALILGLGVTVGSIIVIIYLPILTLGRAVQKSGS